ncbi:hypothetical protein B0H11DRAFT_2291366 [Mycena galericulata]|nr:hypothetical protein B0H11DRAFT_2291366 [Mycena galericulata]
MDADCTYLKPFFSSPDIPVPAARLDLVHRLGAVVALLLISGQYPTPLDPAILQFFIHEANLHLLHPAFDDLSAFNSHFISIHDTTANCAIYRQRDLATHLSLGPNVLYASTLGPADPQCQEWVAFRSGFNLPCINGFTFPSAVRAVEGGSEAFLSDVATSFISTPEAYIETLQFLTPPSGALGLRVFLSVSVLSLLKRISASESLKHLPASFRALAFS